MSCDYGDLSKGLAALQHPFHDPYSATRMHLLSSCFMLGKQTSVVSHKATADWYNASARISLPRYLVTTISVACVLFGMP